MLSAHVVEIVPLVRGPLSPDGLAALPPEGIPLPSLGVDFSEDLCDAHADEALREDPVGGRHEVTREAEEAPCRSS